MALKLNLNLASIQKVAAAQGLPTKVDATSGTIEAEPIKQSEVSKESSNVTSHSTPKSGTIPGRMPTSSDNLTSSDNFGASSYILERLAQLQQDLVAVTPNIAGCLREIHKALLADPEQVTLLTSEQRAIFFQGLSKHTNTVITTTASKTSSRSNKKEFSNMSLDDLL